MDIELRENERIDDLEFKNLKIIQNRDGFCFGIDAVLLSDFAKDLKRGSTVIDLGTGTGIISILLCGKTDLKKIFGVEVQKEVYDMACRSVKLNNLEERFEVINENITDLNCIFDSNSFDVVVTNPPYKKRNTGIINEQEKKLISRHEVIADLEDFISVSNRLLKDKGEFYMIHRPDRIVDIFYLMRRYKIEPKEVRLVFSNEKNPPKMVLIKGVKNGGEYLRFRENLYVYNDDGSYTNEILNIYNKRIY